MAELKSRGGDGTSGGMEPRLAVLEAEMKHVKENLAKLGSVPTDLATLKERIAHLPGKGFVVTAAVSTVGALTGILVLLSKLGVLSAG